MEFTIDKLAKEVAEKVLDEIIYEGKTIREWAEILVKQQPSEDCISREAVIRLVEQYPNIIGNRCSGLIADIKHLPPVTPQYTDEEIDKAQAVEQAYVDKMVELAVEKTKRPNGEWIVFRCGDTDTFKCSECGMRVINPYKYCPICGSYNGGGR